MHVHELLESVGPSVGPVGEDFLHLQIHYTIDASLCQVVHCRAFTAGAVIYDDRPGAVIYDDRPGAVIYDDRPGAVIYDDRPLRRFSSAFSPFEFMFPFARVFLNHSSAAYRIPTSVI